MKCNDCGFSLDGNIIVTMHDMICHRCGGIWHDQEIKVGNHVCDSIYGNGQRTHIFAVIPYKCPICQGKISAHEFYCGILPEDGYEVLETVAIASHPRMPHV